MRICVRYWLGSHGDQTHKLLGCHRHIKSACGSAVTTQVDLQRVNDRVPKRLFSRGLNLKLKTLKMFISFLKIAPNSQKWCLRLLHYYFKSSWAPLIESLCSSNPCEFDYSIFRRNRTDDLGMYSNLLWPTEPRLHVRSYQIAGKKKSKERKCGQEISNPYDKWDSEVDSKLDIYTGNCFSDKLRRT